MAETGESIEVFFSYSHKDGALRDELENHLAILKRQGIINAWHYRKIGAGEEWKGAIDKRLNSAHIILLLVSSDFLASDYCYDVEMQRAMARHEDEDDNAVVIPVILRSVVWAGAPFGKLQALPTGAKPVVDWPNLDQAFMDVAEGIQAAVKKLTSEEESEQESSFIRTKKKSQPTKIWNIPHRRNPNFTGREELLAGLREALTSGEPAALTQAIKGLGGVGKTQLALEYAYRHAADYDLVWWVRSEETASLISDYAALAVELDLPQKEERDQRIVVGAVWRELEHRTKWLLVFDNVEKPDDVREYLPRGQTGQVIVTSRHQVWDGVASELSVEVLDEQEAVEFLLKRTGQTDEDAARKLAEKTGYLPLALEQAGAYIRQAKLSLGEYLERYETRQQELLKRGKPSTEYTATVATTWEISFAAVEKESPAAAELLYLCAFLAPDDIPPDVIREGAEHLPETLAETVSEPLALDEAIIILRRFSLIDKSEDALSVHRLVQVVIRHRLDEKDRRLWAEVSLKIIHDAFSSKTMFTNVEIWPRCARLLPHALTVAAYAEQLNIMGEYTSSLLVNIGAYQQTRGLLLEAKPAYERALKIDEASFGPDHANVATDVNNLGTVLKELGDLSGAREHFERALTIDEASLGPDHPSVARDVNNLGGVLQDLGDLPGAREHFERALKIDEASNGPDHPEVAIRVNNLGMVLQDLGDLSGARAHYERALKIDEASYGPDHPNVARDVNNLGSVLKALGDLSGAREHGERALSILRKFFAEDHPYVVMVRENLELLEKKMKE